MRIIIILIICISQGVLADDILLDVKVTLKEDRGIPPDRGCNEDKEERAEKDNVVEEYEHELETICIIWAGYYIYNAEVENIYLGDFDLTKFTFSKIQHMPSAEKKKATRMVILLEENPEKEHIAFTGTKYYVSDWDYSGDLICFERELKVFQPSKNKRGEYCISMDNLRRNHLIKK